MCIRDSSDVMNARDTGWIILFVSSAQEAYDTVIQAYRVAEDPDVLLPVMVAYDGYVMSHTMEPVVTEDRGFLKEKLIEFEGVVPCSLDEGEEYPLFMWKDFLWELSEKIKRAYLIVFDYGDSCGELSFRAYRSNRLVNDYLEKIGETDLTASVDFTYLRSLLEKVGFKFVSLKPQSSFLLENGIERFLKPSEVPAALTLLVDMGRKFKVLEVLKELSPF
jgi:hypothetical protein